jgi:hypothetical protein
MWRRVTALVSELPSRLRGLKTDSWTGITLEAWLPTNWTGRFLSGCSLMPSRVEKMKNLQLSRYGKWGGLRLHSM